MGEMQMNKTTLPPGSLSGCGGQTATKWSAGAAGGSEEGVAHSAEDTHHPEEEQHLRHQSLLFHFHLEPLVPWSRIFLLEEDQEEKLVLPP